MIDKFISIILLISSISVNAFAQGEINKANKLLKNKYWDPCYNNQLGGREWYFSKDSVFKEFLYENGKRKSMDYGDIEWNGFKYEVRGDTLCLLDYNGYKFVILKITKDSLLLKDVSKYKYVYRDTLLYIKSKDQSSYPLPLGK